MGLKMDAAKRFAKETRRRTKLPERDLTEEEMQRGLSRSSGHIKLPVLDDGGAAERSVERLTRSREERRTAAERLGQQRAVGSFSERGALSSA